MGNLRHYPHDPSRCDWLHDNFKAVPFFSTSLGSGGMLPAAIVLAIMIGADGLCHRRGSLVSVPPKLREAAYGLGAMRWEALFSVILPTAKIGIFGAILLAFGRALGETMALAMLVGGRNVINPSLFSPADTLAALLASSFPEAGTNVELVGASCMPHWSCWRSPCWSIFSAPDPAKFVAGAEGRPMMEDPVVRNRAIAAAAEAGRNVSLAELETSLRRPRTLLSFLFTTLTPRADARGPGTALFRDLHACGQGNSQAELGVSDVASAGGLWRRAGGSGMPLSEL